MIIYNKPSIDIARSSYSGMHQRIKSSKNNGVTICEEWYDFKEFNYWFKEQYDNGWWEKGWHLDKDIISRGAKIYCPEYCAYVPPHINTTFIQAFNKNTNYTAARGVSRMDYIDGNGDWSSVWKAEFKADGKIYHVGEFDHELEAFFMCKFAKEQYIQEEAEKYKDRLNPKMYEALMSYRVMPR